MRAVVQRVTQASVEVEGKTVGEISAGLLVLLGVAEGDSEQDAIYLADKISNLRIFNDADGKMNRSLLDVGGSLLVVSQFTLLGDTRRGRRPSFIEAADPAEANRLYEYFAAEVRRIGPRVETGIFQAMMRVSLINDGPVTILLDSRKLF